MNLSHDTFAAILDQRLRRRNERLWNHLLAWTEILDALGWCVAVKTEKGLAHLSPNALAEISAHENEPTWEAVTDFVRSVSIPAQAINSENLHVWYAASPRIAPIHDGIALTPRENEVLMWLREGKTGPEIAAILGCAQRTVETHVMRLYRKLGFHNRTQVLFNAGPN